MNHKLSLILHLCSLIGSLRHVVAALFCKDNRSCSYLYQFSPSVVSDSLQPHGLQHARLLCLLPTPGACSNSCSLSQWCHPTISSSVVPFSSHPQSFPASCSFPMSEFFLSGGQSIGVSASASVLPKLKYWFPLGLTVLMSLQSKWLSRVFFNTTVQKYQFFLALSLLYCWTLTSIHDY